MLSKFTRDVLLIVGVMLVTGFFAVESPLWGRNGYEIAHTPKTLMWNTADHNEHFVGRSGFMNELSLNLAKFAGKVSIIAITGMSGIGKTQTAKRFAEIFRDNYDIVWWFDASKDIATQYRAFAHEWNRRQPEDSSKISVANLSDAAVVKKVKQLLSEMGKRWLLVFDNAAARGSIIKYIPDYNVSSQGHVIITSKNPVSWRYPMNLRKFDRKESIELLKKITNENDEQQASELANLLNDYPLAIAQAGSFIKTHPTIDQKKYCNLFQEQRKLLWDKEKKIFEKHQGHLAARDDYKHTVCAALQLSINELKDASKSAYDLLVLCAFLNGQKIPSDLLKRWMLRNQKHSNLTFEMAISALLNSSLIESSTLSTTSNDSETTYNVHELVQFVIQDQFQKENKNRLLEEAIQIIGEDFDKSWDAIIPYINERPYLLDHAETLCLHGRDLENEHLFRLKVHMLEFYLYARRDHKRANELIAELERLLGKLTEIDDPTLGLFLLNKVYLKPMYHADEPESVSEAIEETLKALKIFEKLPGQKKEKVRCLAYCLIVTDSVG